LFNVPQIWSALLPPGRKQVVQKALSLLRQRDPHRVFEHPVTDEEAPSYSDIIARPMAFETVEGCGRKGRYGGASGLKNLAQDLDLIFSNCMEYNEEGSPLWEVAAELRGAVQGVLQACADAALRRQDSAAGSDGANSSADSGSSDDSDADERVSSRAVAAAAAAAAARSSGFGSDSYGSDDGSDDDVYGQRKKASKKAKGKGKGGRAAVTLGPDGTERKRDKNGKLKQVSSPFYCCFRASG
jgi:Bromodomain